MSAGKILVSDNQGNYLLKFVGDVRVTLCGSLNRHMETIFGSQDVKKVIVDMLEAEGLDSTTLGLMAKLGLHMFGVCDGHGANGHLVSQYLK